jgi:hypothetical protein
MIENVQSLLEHSGAKLRTREVYGAPGDSLSLRAPGTDAFLLATPEVDAALEVSFESPDDAVADLHASIYRSRPDAGAIVVGTTPWSAALAATGKALPALFDEQARHLGATRAPVAAGSQRRVVDALRGGSNAAVYGEQRLCLGSTPGRVVLNADLFEKCAKAFVVGHASGLQVRTLPIWMQHFWVRRLRRDQKRAARAYAKGRIPEGMDAY